MINSDISVQVKIKFTFTIYEYIIVYEYILLSKLVIFLKINLKLKNILKSFILKDICEQPLQSFIDSKRKK